MESFEDIFILFGTNSDNIIHKVLQVYGLS